MEQLLEIAGRDMDGSSADGRVVFGEERVLEAMEDLEDLEDEEEDEEDEEIEVDEEDLDEDDEEEEEEEDRPVKRQRGADALSHLQQNTIAPLGGGAGGGGSSAGARDAEGSGAGSTLSGSAGDGSDDSDDDDNDDQEKEVIEILSDEEDAHSSHGQTPASFGREPLHRSRSTTRPDFGAHSEGGRGSHQGSRDHSGLSSDRPAWSLRYHAEHGGARDSPGGAKPPLPDFRCRVPPRDSLPSLQQQQHQQHQQKQPHLPMSWPEPSRSRTSGGGGSGGGGGGSFVPPWMARSCSPRNSPGRGAGGEDGKPSAEDKIGAARAESPLTSWAGEVAVLAAGGAAEVEVEAETEVETAKVSAAAAAAATSVTSNLGKRNSPSDDVAAVGGGGDGGDGAGGATIAPTVVVAGAGAGAAAAATTTTEFPLNLECAICLSPIAVAALFACGHGSCWECAHEWCSRNTSPSMDCPTCHVSIPRSDFRRCIVLDEVVDRAVAAAGLDDEEWRSRLERGQMLAREAEATRRGARDAQRSAEEAVVEQAAEIQRLKEEARSRAVGRWRRAYEGPPPAMTDYGFRVMSDLDASQRSVEGFTRLRGRRDGGVEAVRSRAGSAASEAAVVATAAVLSMPTSGGGGGYGGVRSRTQAQSGSSAASALGVNGEDPWFSLRSSQPSRHAGVAMPGGGGRIGREVFGRSNVSGGRNTAHSTTAGLDQSAGAALKSAHERDGSNWRSAYFGPGQGGPTRMPRTAPGDIHQQSSGGRARNSTLSSIHTMMAVPSGPLAVEPMRGPAAPGRRPAAQAPPARSSRKRLSLRGFLGEGGAAAAAAAAAATPATSAARGSASYSAAEGGVAPAGPPFGYGGCQRDNSSHVGGHARTGGGGGGGAAAAGGASGLRFDPDFHLEPLDMIPRHDDLGARSEWDDVLAAVSMPHQAAAPRDSLAQGDSPDRTRD